MVVSSSELWYCSLPWPKVLGCWGSLGGCVGTASPRPSPVCGGNLAQVSSFPLAKGGYKGGYGFSWSVSLHGCCLSRGAEGLSCSQVRQPVLNPDRGTCCGCALLSLLLILQLFWGFVNLVT